MIFNLFLQINVNFLYKQKKDENFCTIFKMKKRDETSTFIRSNHNFDFDIKIE